MRLSNEYIISIIDQNKLSPPVYALAVQFLQKNIVLWLYMAIIT